MPQKPLWKVRPECLKDVRKAWKAEGVTRGAFAARIYRSRSTISEFLLGKPFGREICEEICDEIGVDPDEVLMPHIDSQQEDPGMSAKQVVKLVFQEAYPNNVDLSKQFTAEALNNLQVLQTLIWEQLQEKPGVEAIRQEFEQTQRMTPEQVAQMATLLESAMNEDPKFADEIQQLAQTIDEGRLDEQSGRVWNQIINGENNEGYQFEVTGSSTAYIGGKHYHGKQD